MTTNIKAATQELKSLVAAIAEKDELLKSIKESYEPALKIAEQIKESQEEYKVALAAHLDYFTIENEKKELVKELGQGCKAATRDTGFNPAVLKAFLKASLKSDEAVDKQIDKGVLFRSLQNQTA